jgi:predicted component of type VI protein secretion system
MAPQQAHELKLKIALFAESTAMLALLKDKEQSKWDLALSARDRAREELYTFIDELTEE